MMRWIIYYVYGGYQGCWVWGERFITSTQQGVEDRVNNLLSQMRVLGGRRKNGITYYVNEEYQEGGGWYELIYYANEEC